MPRGPDAYSEIHCIWLNVEIFLKGKQLSDLAETLSKCPSRLGIHFHKVSARHTTQVGCSHPTVRLDRRRLGTSKTAMPENKDTERDLKPLPDLFETSSGLLPDPSQTPSRPLPDPFQTFQNTSRHFFRHL